MREQGRRHWRRQWVIRPQGVLRVVGHTTWMVVPVAINQVHCWADSVVVVKRMHDRNAKPACDVRQVQTVPGEVTEIGRAHVWTPVTNAHLVCRLLLEKKTSTKQITKINHQNYSKVMTSKYTYTEPRR